MKVLIDADSIAYKAAACAKDDLVLMRQVIDTEMGNILSACDTKDYEAWIENPVEKEIFRDRVAVTRPYKGNRSNTQRPALLWEAKVYLCRWWNAKVTSVFESEDVVISRAYQEGLENVVVAAIDKDIVKNFPARFYNYRTGAFSQLSEKQAEGNLWRQVATGDSCDNIPGIPKVGAKKAAHVQTREDCAKLYKDNNCSYEYFIEQSNLIIIRKELITDIIYPITKEVWDEI